MENMKSTTNYSLFEKMLLSIKVKFLCRATMDKFSKVCAVLLLYLLGDGEQSEHIWFKNRKKQLNE